MRISDWSSDVCSSDLRTVQAFVHEAADRRHFSARVEAAFQAARQRVAARAMLTAVVMLLVFGAVSIILWIGGHDVLSGRISAGALSAYVFYALVVAGAAGAFSSVVGDRQEGRRVGHAWGWTV